MAVCPKCSAAMGAMDVACPACGYDFPEDPVPRREGFAYSSFADVALIISMVAAGLGCAAALFFAVVSLLMGSFRDSFVGFIAFFGQLGMLIVFMRVSDLKP